MTRDEYQLRAGEFCKRGFDFSMNQTRVGSLIESLMNIAIGYFVALLSQLAIFPMFGIHVSLSKGSE